MKKILLYILLLLPAWCFAQQAQPVNPVQVTQTTLYNEPSTGTRWWYNGATLGWYPIFPYSPPNTVLTGLGMSVVSSTLTVATGTWRINSQVYSLSSPANFTLQARDTIYSRYETVYAIKANNGIGIKVGQLSPTPIQPTVGADSLVVGAALITPTVTIVIPPGPSNQFVFAIPGVQQSYANPWVRTLRADTIKVAGKYIFPSVDGTSAQVLQTDGSGHLYWSSQAIYTPGFGLNLNAQAFSVDTTKIVTLTAMLDTLHNNAAHFDTTQFSVVNDTIHCIACGVSGPTIYTGDGTLASDRTVALNNHFLQFTDTNSGYTGNYNFGNSGFVAHIDNGSDNAEFSSSSGPVSATLEINTLNLSSGRGSSILMGNSNDGMNIQHQDYTSGHPVQIRLGGDGLSASNAIDSTGIRYTSYTDYWRADSLTLMPKQWIEAYVAAHSGGTTTNAVTFNNSGSGAASGTTFDGSSAKTISYNTIGAQQTLTLTTTGTSGAATLVSGTLNIPQYSGATAGNPTGLLTFTAANGTASTYKRSDGLNAIDSTVVASYANHPTFAQLQTKVNGYVPTSTTVAGFALSSNVTLANHAPGFGLSGSNYNGSGAQTWIVDTTAIATPYYVKWVAGPDGIVSGMSPTTISGTTATVPSGVYRLNNLLITKASSTNVTIDAQDATLNRYDLIVGDASGVLTKVSGTLGTDAAQPDVPANKALIAYIYIPATGGTVVSGGGGGKGTTQNALSGGYGVVPFTFNGGTAGIKVVVDTTSSTGLVSKGRLATNLGGYVKSVSVASANGLSGTSSGGQTPSLTLTLSTIKPNVVAQTPVGTAGTDSVMVKHSDGTIKAISPTYYGTGGGSTLTFGTHLTSGGASYNGSAPVTITSDATNAATASTIMSRDANANVNANNLIYNYTTTATTNTTTTLTVSSAKLQYFTGTQAQTVVLPNVSTLVVGMRYEIVSLLTGTSTINVQSSGGNAIVSIAANNNAVFTVISTSGTGASSWAFQYFPSLDNTGLLNINSLNASTQIVSGYILATSALETAGNPANTNFMATGGGSMGSDNTNPTFGGATKTSQRVMFNGGSTGTVPNTDNYANVIFGSTPFSVANATTIPWGTNVAIKAPGTITLSGTGTVTNTASLYIDGVSSTGTNNYAVYVASGNTNVASLNTAFVSKSANYTLTDNDYSVLSSGSGTTITLPTAVGRLGRIYTIKRNDGTNTQTVGTTSSQTIDGSTTYSLSADKKYVTVQSDNANWWIIANN